jgi:hypothetical protein
MASFFTAQACHVVLGSITAKPNGKFDGNGKNVLTMPKFGLLLGEDKHKLT